MSVDFDRMAANLPADQRKQLSRQYRRGAKNETMAFLFCFFFGIFGLHHFYLGEWGRGFVHLILPVLAAIAVLAGTLGNFPSLPITIVVIVLLLAALIWEIVELFRIDAKVRQRNVHLAEALIGASALADSATLTDAVARLDSALTETEAAGATTPGTITADDVLAARAMAGGHNNAVMEEFDSSTTTYISEDPSATSPGAPTSWTESGPNEPLATATEPANPSADDTLDMPSPEYVTHTHTETAHSVTDSYEFDRVPEATQPTAIPTPSESEAKTWPDHPPLEEPQPVTEPANADVSLDGSASGATALEADTPLADAAPASETAEDLVVLVSETVAETAAPNAGPDATDHHAQARDAHPIADMEGAGSAPLYVALPADEPPAAEVGSVREIAAESPVADAAPASETAAETATPSAAPVPNAGPDATDHHAQARDAHPIADMEGAGSAPLYVALPADEPPAADAAGFAPLAVDASTATRDATDAHSQVHHTGLVADVEANPAQPVYVDLPGETYVPPVVPQTPQTPSADAANGAAAEALAGMAGAGAAYLASQADESQPVEAVASIPEVASNATPEAAPESGPPMKRIRMKRQIVVDGQVMREVVVEKMVPAGTDTSALVAEMDTELGHATKEEIARMAHLDPDASFEVRQRFDTGPLSQEPAAE